MKVFRVAAIATMLTGPAFAQMPNINLMPEVVNRTPEQKEQDAIRDKAYKESLRKIPDCQRRVRSLGHCAYDGPKSAAKQVKPRTKTGSVAPN